jgi:hypothetical protein
MQEIIEIKNGEREPDGRATEVSLTPNKMMTPRDDYSPD